jgi:hypothetical protein
MAEELDLTKLEVVPLVLDRGSACRLAFLSTPLELRDLGIVEEPLLFNPFNLVS